MNDESLAIAMEQLIEWKSLVLLVAWLEAEGQMYDAQGDLVETVRCTPMNKAGALERIMLWSTQVLFELLHGTTVAPRSSQCDRVTTNLPRPVH